MLQWHTASKYKSRGNFVSGVTRTCNMPVFVLDHSLFMTSWLCGCIYIVTIRQIFRHTQHGLCTVQP